MFEKLGDELKQAREKANLTIEQVSIRTKLDLKFLKMIEIGDFSFLPDLYVKAFLKEYSKTVGLDEETILRKYKLIKEGKYTGDGPLPELIEQHAPPAVKSYETASRAVDGSFGSDPQPELQKSNSSAGAYIAAGISIFLLAAFLIYHFASKNSNTEIVTNTLQDTTSTTVNRFEDDTTEKIIAPLPNDSLTLNVNATQDVWFYVRFDKVKEQQFYLTTGEKKVLRAKQEFYLNIGNPYGIELTLNNKPISFIPDPKGMQITIDVNGLKQTPPRPVQQRDTSQNQR